jgi:hypothetical protein
VTPFDGVAVVRNRFTRLKHSVFNDGALRCHSEQKPSGIEPSLEAAPFAGQRLGDGWMRGYANGHVAPPIGGEARVCKPRVVRLFSERSPIRPLVSLRSGFAEMELPLVAMWPEL